MKLAIVHYHLRRGGVTRVIETALESLARSGDEFETVVLTGEMPGELSPLSKCSRCLPGLAYRNEIAGIGEAEHLVSELRRVATEALGGEPDLWHFHNHSLAKNVAMPTVIQRLAAEGARLLLQIHDFAEDGRPENFRRQCAAANPAEIPWYPIAPQIQYAVLNQRDADYLVAAGLPNDRLHLLPNAVASLPCEPATSAPTFVKKGQRFLLYPTRGIRRKNLGELLLLAALSNDDVAFASTLAPENPEWLAIHGRWENFAARHRLPVRLGIGADPAISFAGLVGAADAMVTTSVAEGFGLAFLEPWLAGKAIRGRDLPEITADFSEHGVSLDGLYRRLEVPTAWVDLDRFRDRLGETLPQTFASYGRELPSDAIDAAYAAAVSASGVDFGRLDEPLQEQVLETLLADPAKLRSEVELPDLAPAPEECIAQNAQAISESYGLAAYGERLGNLYRQILRQEAEIPRHLDGQRLLDAFLDPSRFTLLRS